MEWLNSESKTLVDSFDIATVLEKLQPMLQALGQLNTKNSEANPKGKHVKKVLSTLYKNDYEVDKAMKDMVQLGGSMFLMGIQYLVVKELLSNPFAYVNKMVGDNPDITDFKADPSVAGLTMLKSTCTNPKTQSETSASTPSTSNFLSELEHAD